MNSVTRLEDGSLRCSCGASADHANRRVFGKTHPVKCWEQSEYLRKQKEFTKKLAGGTRTVDEEEFAMLIEPTEGQKLVIHQLVSVMKFGKGLTLWEKEFMEYTSQQWREKEWLSDKQRKILDRIYSDRT